MQKPMIFTVRRVYAVGDTLELVLERPDGSMASEILIPNNKRNAKVYTAGRKLKMMLQPIPKR